MQAIILSIGDELVLGQTVDTNAAWLSGQLAKLGITVCAHATVADDREHIAKTIDQAARDAKLVLITGGIGPTQDDLTRQALADAMGVELIESQEALDSLDRFFAHRGRDMPTSNLLQALHPAGSTILPNAAGTAPGIWATLHGADLFVTPGVPREMVLMYQQAIEPQLRQHQGSRATLLTATLHTFGVGEAQLAQTLGPLAHRDRNPRVGTTVAQGICSVRIRSEFADPHQAQHQLDDTLAQLRDRLGPIAFGCDDQTLQEVVIHELIRQQQTLATAESCTGGRIGALLTDVPGSSQAYLGGWITYANAMKISQLGVLQTDLDHDGAVSQNVAQTLAQQARKRSGADLALAVTGIAGPQGGTDEKPVGTVWIALATADDLHTIAFQFIGDRDTIRDRAAKSAMQMLRLHLIGQPLSLLSWVRQPTPQTSSS